MPPSHGMPIPGYHGKISGGRNIPANESRQASSGQRGASAIGNPTPAATMGTAKPGRRSRFPELIIVP